MRPFERASRIIWSVDWMVTPLRRAWVFEVWMVGPSAMGSVKGTPTSITSVCVGFCQFSPVCFGESTEHTSTTLLHAYQDIGCVLRLGVASSDISDEGRLREDEMGQHRNF